MRLRFMVTAAIAVAFTGCSDTDPLGPANADLSPSFANENAAAGAVYVMSNAAAGNAVMVFSRSPDGTLVPAGTFATGGAGSGSGLGSQGALVLSDDGRFLLAVNAGSDELSVFRVTHNGLERTDVVASGGDMPISVTVHRSLVYVLNAGGAGNIAGFSLSSHGSLSALAGSVQPLSGAGTGPAQIQFSPDGDVLVVTEKMANQILTYTVGSDGLASAPIAHPSAGMTPFGFAFGKRNQLVVSEAFGGAADASAASSYKLAGSSLTTLSASAPTTETAACWVAISNNGRYAYTTNTGSSSVSGYRISELGGLTLLDADGRTGLTGAGTSPIDAGFSRNGQFLYVLTGGNASIAVFAFNADGSLTSIESETLPAGSVGLAAQ